MNIQFDSYEEYDLMVETVKSGILYWKKVKQDAQGKICIQCDGTQTHYTVDEADEKIGELLKLLMSIEATPHLEWNGEMTEGAPEFYSSMIESNKQYLKG